MPYQVTSTVRRAWWAALATGGAALLAAAIVAAASGAPFPTAATLFVLSAVVLGAGGRGLRSATLIAGPYRVTSRELARTTHWSWPVIEGFVAETRPAQTAWRPGTRLRHRTLGVVHSGGRTRWLPEMSCRPRDGKPTWIDTTATRLNELLAAHAA